MECLKNDGILKFRPDTLEKVREEVNLDKPGRINEAIDLLADWLQKQPHLIKKDFSREYLERTLISAKGLVERAKGRIDKLCTLKTLMPEFFETTNYKKEYDQFCKFTAAAHMPQLTPNHHRVYVSKILTDNFESSVIISFYKYLVALCEYLKREDYCTGFHIVIDCTSINVLNFVSKVSPVELSHIVTMMTDGYGMRIKGVHVISSSKMVDALMALLRQVFSSKLSNRIHHHKTIDTLLEYMPQDILPADYGGLEKELIELNKDWFKVISSKEFVDYMKEMKEAKTNESCRQADKFNENYVGMPGSFRALSVD